MARALGVGLVAGAALFIAAFAAFMFGLGPVELVLDRDTIHHL